MIGIYTCFGNPKPLFGIRGRAIREAFSADWHGAILNGFTRGIILARKTFCLIYLENAAVAGDLANTAVAGNLQAPWPGIFFEHSIGA